MKPFTRCVFLAALLGATPALAQDGDGLRPLDPDGIKDMGGWLGEDEVDPAPQPDAASDPLADPLASPPAAKPAPEPELTPEERRKRGRAIDRNYSKAQEIYQGIINADKVGPLDKRIANNERIIRDYNARIRAALKERRELQVNVFNQSFYLKQQADRGSITRDAYEQMITEEEQKYESRVAELKSNVQAWRQEVRAAKALLADLQAKRRVLVASRPKLRRIKRKRAEQAPKARPGSRLLGSLRQRLKKLHVFETKNTLTSVHPRDLGSPMRVEREAPELDRGDSAGGDLDEVPEEEEGFWDD